MNKRFSSGCDALAASRTCTGELDLQARWFAGEFGREFIGTAGEVIRVVQFGTWNRMAGPDFVDASVSINHGDPVRGSIEIDPDARDWERHGHATNPDYEDVVLHVFLSRPESLFFSRTLTHRQIPQILLNASSFRSPADALLPRPGRCARSLQALSITELKEVLTEAAHYRFERKARVLARSAAVHGHSEALFQSVSAGMGYPNNQLPFRLLSQRLPIQNLQREADCIESLLFGVAGFLPGPDLSRLTFAARTHSRALWEGWWPRRAANQALCVPAKAWRLSGQRPANHPQRRVGALSVLARHWRSVVRLVGSCEWKRLRLLLDNMSHPFWEHHYTFNSAGVPKPLSLLGRERIDELLINVFLPFTRSWDTLLKLKAPDRNRRSRMAAARLLVHRAELRPLMRDAVFQQGILQLHEDFCAHDATDCAHCPFPEQVRGFAAPE